MEFEFNGKKIEFRKTSQGYSIDINGTCETKGLSIEVVEIILSYLKEREVGQSLLFSKFLKNKNNIKEDIYSLYEDINPLIGKEEKEKIVSGKNEKKVDELSNIENENLFEEAPKNLSEKIEERLTKAQENNEFSKDFGIEGEDKRFGFSQKSKIALNKLTFQEFVSKASTLSTSEKISNFKVEKFIQPYNPIIDKENGILPGVIFLKQELLNSIGDRIGKKPDLKGLKEKEVESLLYSYPIILQEYNSMILNSFSYEDLISQRKRIITPSRVYNLSEVIGIDGYQDKNNLERILGKKTLSVLLNQIIYNVPLGERYIKQVRVFDYAKKFDSVSQEDVDREYSIYLETIEAQIKLEKEKTQKQIDNDYDEVCQRQKRYYSKTFEISREDFPKYIIDKLESQKLTKAQLIEKRNLEIRENDFSFIKEVDPKEPGIKKEGKTKETGISDILNYGIEIEKETYDIIEEIKRKGFSHKEYTLEDITSLEDLQDLMLNKLSFSKVNFGNTVKDNFAREQGVNTANALFDLKEITGLNVEKINKLHGLGIGYGVASGGGSGGTMASYFPSERFINLTKVKGDGCLSHEYFHFLDNFLFTKMTDSSIYGGDNLLTTIQEKNIPIFNTPLFDKIQELKYLMNYQTGISNDDTFEKVIYPTKISNGIYKLKWLVTGKIYRQLKELELTPIEFKKKGLENIIDYVEKSGRVGKSYNNDLELFAQDFLNKFFYDNIEFGKKFIDTNGKEGINPIELNNFVLPFKASTIQSGRLSNYYKGSFKAGGNSEKKQEYFTSTKEMFARAFESYVEDKLRSLGKENNFLTASNLGKSYYPQEEERKNINKKFDELMILINEFVERI